MDLSTKVAQLLKDQTNEMYSEKWYNQTANKINILFNSDMKGYVYFIQSLLSKHIKIGVTIDIKKRMSSIKQTNGDLHFLGFIYCENYFQKENFLHKSLSDKRIYGEWFGIDIKSTLEIIEENNGTVVNKKFSETLIIEDGILLSDLSLLSNGTDKYNYNIVLNYIKSNTYAYIRYDLKQIHNELLLDISQKKCTQFIQKSVAELGYTFEMNRTHNSRGFIYK